MRISGITYIPRKTHTLRNSLVILFTFLFILLLIILSVSFYTGWKLIHPDKMEVAAFESNLVPEFSDVGFKGADSNLFLRGWYFKAKAPEKTVILIHEYGKNRLQFGSNTLSLIKSLVYSGYNVLTFDMRNSGKSGGKIATFGSREKDDILASVNYAKSQGSKYIALLGFSTGASAGLMAAAQSQEIGAVIADSPYSDLRQYIRNKYSAEFKLPKLPFDITVPICIELLSGIDMDKINPSDYVGRISPRPVLFIYGGSSASIPVRSSKSLYNIYKKTGNGQVEFWETDTRESAGSYEKMQQQYVDRILLFLSKAFEKK